MDLKNRVVWIVGGARIGSIVAEELAKRGAHIALSYRSSRDAAQQTAKRVQQFGVRSGIFKGDVTKSGDVKKIIGQIAKTFGKLNVLVNMASIYEKTPLAKLTEADWEKSIAANLKSAFLTVLHGQALLEKSEGRVVNFSDWVAGSGRPRYTDFLPYFTAKSGVIGLTQAQALELAPKILVNAIAPGPILPPKGIKNEEVDDVASVTPLKKWGGPMEIAKAVIFLCETDFVTGECLRVDGGRHLY